MAKKENARYYTLQYLKKDSGHRAGERIAFAGDALGIGQREDCEVRLDNDSAYADEVFAVIRTADTGSAVIVPVSDHVATHVNGLPIKVMQTLRDGDRISFGEGNQELKFRTHLDSGFDPAQGNRRIAARTPLPVLIFIILAPLLVCGLLAWYVYENALREEKADNMIAALEKNVCQLSVDSVYYCMIVRGDTTVLRRYSYAASEGHMISGSAFFTSDSLLVTARHCIEPWLNDDAALKGNPDSIVSMPSRWALEAETYNQTHDTDTVYKVVSQCILTGGRDASQEVGARLYSSDFCYDPAADDIIELGDYDSVSYWRSVRRHNSRTDMMLGDIAFTRVGSPGTLQAADEEFLRTHLKPGRKLYFIGYPDFSQKGRERNEGKLKLPYDGGMLSHSGHLVHGYSGGPVIMIADGEPYVVGVVSVTDENGGDRMYAVPISKKGGCK